MPEKEEKKEEKKPETTEEAIATIRQHAEFLESRMGNLEDLVLDFITPKEGEKEDTKPKKKVTRCKACNHVINLKKKCPYCGAKPEQQ